MCFNSCGKTYRISSSHQLGIFKISLLSMSRVLPVREKLPSLVSCPVLYPHGPGLPGLSLGRSSPRLGGSERLEFFLGRSWGASRGRKGRAKILSLWLRCQADPWDLARGTYSCRAEGKKPPLGAPQRAGSSSSLEPDLLQRRGASWSPPAWCAALPARRRGRAGLPSLGSRVQVPEVRAPQAWPGK